jgi:tRNA threonylcarbamoyladenosine biosynthesis protein TsaB
MLTLAIDTASALVTVALRGDAVRACASREGAQAHGELLAPTIDALLREHGVTPADLARVVVGVGPGPFTGLRVGIVTARVLGEALGIPVAGVCSLDAVALDAAAAGAVTSPFSVLTDARRKEVYAAAYDATGRRQGAPYVARPADLGADVRSGPVVGVGAELCRDLLADVRPSRAYAKAWLGLLDALAVAPDAVELLDTTPLYLRRPDAVENAARKRVTQP